MREEQLFGLVAMLALLVWLGSNLLPAEHRRTFERLALILIGGGILVAVVLTVLHFLG